MKNKMINAMVREIEIRHEYLADTSISTIYLGGGTPSLLDKEELNLLLDFIRMKFQIDNDAEISLEANPEDISPESLDIWHQLGINRLSIGLQVFHDAILASWNRNHNRATGEAALDLAVSAGFANISVDLMYGHPDLDNEEWTRTIEKVLEKGIPHISSYALTVEAGTALAHQIKKGIATQPEDEHSARQFALLQNTTQKFGLRQYEVSNFSKPGFESRHNTSYWKQSHYLGIGPAAHSFNGISRQWNISNNALYISSVERGVVPFEAEVLQPYQRYNELIMTGLRTTAGIDKEVVSSLGKGYLSNLKKDIQSYLRAGRIIEEERNIRLPADELFFADGIASDLFLLSDLSANDQALAPAI